MVAKISIGSSLYGAISYNGEKINEAKGRILAANKIILPPDGKVSVNGMVENFKVFMPKMGRTKNRYSISPLIPIPMIDYRTKIWKSWLVNIWKNSDSGINRGLCINMKTLTATIFIL